MNNNRYFFRSFILSIMVFAQLSLAVSPRVDLIDLENNLADNRYSPVLGYMALASNILKHMRQDLPAGDPLREILWTLFPHPAKHEVTRRKMADCFGVEVKDPAVIQSLFRYLMFVRNDPALIQAMEQFYSGDDKIEVTSYSDENIKQIVSKKRLERECYSYIDQLKSHTQKLFKSGFAIVEGERAGNDKLLSLRKSLLESEFTFKNHIFKMIQLRKYIELNFTKIDNKTRDKVPNTKFIQRTLKPLLININKYLILENKNHYPNYFLEAVLWAFSIQHFESEELLLLRNGLPERVSLGACELGNHSALEIAQKYDYLLNEENEFKFSDYILSKIRLLPMHIYSASYYKLVNVYNRNTHSFEDETYNDCAESSLLGLFAFILFDRHENRFVLDSLLKRQKSLPDDKVDYHQLTFLINYFQQFGGRENYYTLLRANRNLGNKALVGIPNVSYKIWHDGVGNEIPPNSVDLLKAIFGVLNEPNDFSYDMGVEEFKNKLFWALEQIRPGLEYEVSVNGQKCANFKVKVSEMGPPKTTLGTFGINSTGITSHPYLHWPFTHSPLEIKVVDYFAAQNYDDVRGLMSLQARACTNRHPFLEQYSREQYR